MSQISIVIPVYNAEKELNQCLDSVIAQTYGDFEVLLINDGSTDRSKEICEAYCAKDSRFRLINQKNSGPSAARNRGIDEAAGKYITFIDSDDYIELNSLEVLYQKAEESQAEITVFGYYIEKDGETTRYNLGYEPGVYRGKDCKRLSVESIDIHTKKVLPPYSGIRFVRSDFLKGLDLRYDTSIIRSEDYFYWVQVHFHANAVCLATDHAFYHYVENGGSITHRYVKGYWDMALTIYGRLKENLPQEKEIVDRIENMFVHRSLIAMNNAAFAKDNKIFREEMKVILRDSELRRIIRKWDLKTGMRYHGLYYLLMKFHLYFIVKLRYKVK